MSVMRALPEAEYVYTRDGKKRVTHEAYSYMITPFAYPPIKVMVYKGHIDHRGTFQAVDAPKDIVITQDEFKELLCPNAHGKPAGDFRLSDILRCLKKRNSIATDGAKEPAKPAEAKPAEAANAEASVNPEAKPVAANPTPADAAGAAAGANAAAEVPTAAGAGSPEG
jgi:hypothetical protein